MEPEIESDAMGVSRGFRRLSVLAGLAGAAFVGFLWIDSQPSDPPTGKQIVLCLVTFCAAPATFVLVLGWVVVGFRQGD